jgi:glycosyltransferase involved in cell wall biosynthesis
MNDIPSQRANLSVVIPTYNRRQVLLDTIQLLLDQSRPPTEILVVDQTNYKQTEPTFIALKALFARGSINWIRLAKPSIPIAMNCGLVQAQTSHVLFLDDDVGFAPDFIECHLGVLQQQGYAGQYCAHVGQIIQPWQQVVTLGDYQPGIGLVRDLNFPFNCDQDHAIANCMAGNLCVDRSLALQAGGFDEQFDGVAYRFETEFCRRLIAHSGLSFQFAATPTLDHLKVNTGGTRETAKSHLTSLSAAHSSGDYYFALRNGGLESVKYVLKRWCGSYYSKFYLRRPWWIPIRMVSESWGLLSAISKIFKGPRYINKA